MKLWSDIAWDESKDIYNAILELPFIKELSEGTLPYNKYLFYLSQDRLYLQKYFKVLAHIASRIEEKSYAESFLNFALDGIKVEEGLHSFFLSSDAPEERMSPACALYTSTLLSKSYEPVEVEAAAILPCFVVYQRVGLEIISKAKDLKDNPYKAWIETYADEAFKKSTEKAVEICDNLASNTTEAIRKRMTETFRECTRLEWLFWHSAYKLKKWEI